MKIVEEVLAKMQKISQAQLKFMTIYLPLLLSFQGKANFTNLSRYTELNEKTIRRHHQKPFDFSLFNLELMKAQNFKPTVACIDASFVPKSGKHTEGIAKFFSSCQGKAQKGLEVSLVTLMDTEGHSFAIDAKQTLDTEGKSRVNLYLEQVKALSLPASVKWVVADGYYAKAKFINGICDAGLQIVGKLRKDADLKYIFCGPQSAGPGRPRKYAGKVDLKNLCGFEVVGNLEEDTQAYTQVVWHTQFKCKVKVVVLKKEQTHRVFFSTDLQLQPFEILKMYHDRFQIEFFFRDSKQFVGLNDCQARDSKAITFHFNACFSALNVAKVESKALGHQTFSMHSLKMRHYNERLLKQFLFNSALKLSSHKSKKAFDKACRFGQIAN